MSSIANRYEHSVRSLKLHMNAEESIAHVTVPVFRRVLMPCDETGFSYALTHLQEGKSFLLLVETNGFIFYSSKPI